MLKKSCTPFQAGYAIAPFQAFHLVHVIAAGRLAAEIRTGIPPYNIYFASITKGFHAMAV
jgi:hypothetical protein